MDDRNGNRRNRTSWLLTLLLAGLLAGCAPAGDFSVGGDIPAEPADTLLERIPEYAGEPYVTLNDNQPDFTSEELQEISFEEYSSLDELGRCRTAQACVSQELMPEEERGDISSVIPTGWHSVRYEQVEGGSLYNRCHLIGFQLTGENANEENLITGTRYMNVEGMLPFENMVADYVKDTDGHVMYRVTPIYEEDNLVASGVQMEAESVEDQGDSICYNVFIYNVQPGIEIDYATGDSRIQDDSDGDTGENVQTYILNTNTGKFHRESCSSVERIKDENRGSFTGTREEVTALGYEPCGICKP